MAPALSNLKLLAISLALLACLWLYSPDNRLHVVLSPFASSIPKALTFQLAKDYLSRYPDYHRIYTKDIQGGDDTRISTIRTRPTTVYKPRSIERFMNARRDSEANPVEWEEWTVDGPDIEDRHTLQQLAMMSGNAYALPGQKNWYNLDEIWNQSLPVGWEDKADGFRGHVFVSEDESTVILSIKGTTLPLQGPTSKKDKFNDNLLFSCCCAYVDVTWIFATVCDCHSKTGWKCDSNCLSKALVEESLFYSIGINLYANLTAMYPRSNIWLTGHSLGGSLAALLGTTFGVPAVAFEAPGERLAAKRLYLPLPPRSPVTHVYHTADPIPQGACTGQTSLCAEFGYALETGCHLGKKIVYDTIGQYGWRSDVSKHTIREVISKVLEDEREWEPGRQVPLAIEEDKDCIDCYKWEFGEFKDKESCH